MTRGRCRRGRGRPSRRTDPFGARRSRRPAGADPAAARRSEVAHSSGRPSAARGPSHAGEEVDRLRRPSGPSRPRGPAPRVAAVPRRSPPPLERRRDAHAGTSNQWSKVVASSGSSGRAGRSAGSWIRSRSLGLRRSATQPYSGPRSRRWRPARRESLQVGRDRRRDIDVRDLVPRRDVAGLPCTRARQRSRRSA